MSCHFFAVFVKMKDSRCAEEFVSASPILTGRIRTLDVLGSFGQKMSAIFFRTIWPQAMLQNVNTITAFSFVASPLILKSTAVAIGVKVPSTSSLSVYTKVLAHNLNDIRNWASLIGLLLRICWCLLSVFLIYCSDEWKKLVNLIYCFQVLFRMNFKIMYFLMKILGNTPSADSAASRDSLSSQNAT